LIHHVIKRGVCVGIHISLIRDFAFASSVTAIIEEQHIKPECSQALPDRAYIADIAGLPMKEYYRRLRGLRLRGYEPPIQLLPIPVE